MSSQLEFITRMAAKVMGMELAAMVWAEDNQTLYHQADAIHRGYSPLTDCGDAYALEDKLRLGVSYRAVKGTGDDTDQVIMVRSDKHAGAVAMSVPNGSTSLMIRMRAVTQFAALHALMEDEDG